MNSKKIMRGVVLIGILILVVNFTNVLPNNSGKLLPPMETVTYSGYVRDLSGSKLSGAQVSFLNGRTLVKTVYTSSTGYYSFSVLECLLACVRASKSGYITKTQVVSSSGGTYSFALISSDTTPPSISINSPINGYTFTVDSVQVSWSGSDAECGIYRYEIRIDSSSWINKGTATSHTFSGLANGAHITEVRAWNNALISSIDSVTFTVDKPVIIERTKYAVIVGISDYNAMSPLSYCDEDATDWYNHLKGTLGYDYVWVYGDEHTSNYPIYSGLATEYNVKQALIKMVSIAGENDIIAFIVAGHGAFVDTGPIDKEHTNERTETKSITGSTAICTWDCYTGENGEDGYLYELELCNILNSAAAAKIFVFLDTCHSGGFGNRLLSMDCGSRIYCATACTEFGEASPYSTKQNGAWTYFFLEYAWINYYEGIATTSMELIFDYAHAAYPFYGDDDSLEFDGNTGTSFYLV